ncbi:50S ribosomal protein L22 [Campylobacter sp. MIT 21-1685]|uniref:50S ribosomal protein L22 n=1 Tax=unclassified Campylobacter TaxID=2593542 RepID=UPI00224B78DA|nr:MULTISPECIES: 50S ribosomal protein L22 [unclassified Campylobacter]MCX2683616.1 50S ribosomal protein L22 [Campylobacter sp. MIT 21-1684]MCX2751899.1 50S ribosomal protein L22 [Campylobacter sp. MIT 21-1682]MCX2808100.1 50S ribosomal protein L22 [Campylobacter sp. MIT 21-1685]
MGKAFIKYLRISPIKTRLIAREVQGMNAELALASLKFMPNKGAKHIANAISSAVANGGFEANEVIIQSCRVDAGSVLKRFRPRARGSASRIRKPTSHILVEVVKNEAISKKTKTATEKPNTRKTSSKKEN